MLLGIDRNFRERYVACARNSTRFSSIRIGISLLRGRGKSVDRDASGDAQGWNAAADSLRYEKTGLLLLEDSPAPPESRAEWEAAIAEYFAFERKAKPRG